MRWCGEWRKNAPHPLSSLLKPPSECWESNFQRRGYLVDPASIICLSPRLSHARLSTALERQNYAELHRTVAILPHDRRRPSRVGATDNPTKGEANTLILTPKGKRPLTRYVPGGFAGVDFGAAINVKLQASDDPGSSGAVWRGFRCINYTVGYWPTVVVTHTENQGSVL